MIKALDPPRVLLLMTQSTQSTCILIFVPLPSGTSLDEKQDVDTLNIQEVLCALRGSY